MAAVFIGGGTHVHALKRTMTAGLASLVLVAGAARGDEGAAADSSAGTQATKDQIEGIDAQVQTLQTDMDRLKRFKLSGYIQARWETAENRSDSVKVSGNPPTIAPANDERFYIRRGRFKLTYDAAPLSQGAIQFDGASNGASINVRLLEAYVTLLDPWTPLHQHALTAGQMLIPFGYEIERSSAVRELPEFSRAENVLFNAEYDRGIKLVSQWTPQLETVVAVMNGGGINDANYPTTDPTSAKDYLGRVRYAQGTVDGAVSIYEGQAETPLTGPDVVTDRTRFGADLQTYYQMPALGGGTLRGELYAGHDVNPDSVKALTTTPGSGSGLVIKPGAEPSHFATDVLGWYVMWVQNLGEKLQFAARYDTYDANTDLPHDQYERWGVGLNYFYDTYTRITVSYEAPRTERLIAGSYVDPKDNLWTVQFQIKY